jgi:adenine phosphoribosyltransferase
MSARPGRSPGSPLNAGGSARLSRVALDVRLLHDRIRDVEDFPRPGVVFKDITPVLADPVAFAGCVDGLSEPFADQGIHKVLGIEARGFIVAAPVALRLQAGFVPLRKAGKLPWKVESESYSLEYGDDRLEIHADALEPGERVLIVDDVLATGGTASAAVRLVERVGAEVAAFACLIELAFLGGRGKLGALPVVSLVEYE